MKAKKQPWNIGDVYACEIKGEFAAEHGLTGRYFLLQKIADEYVSARCASPIVYAKITRDKTLPTTTEEYNELEFVQTGSTNFEDRFYPFDFSRLEEDIAEKTKLTYAVDEYGYLPEYRARLILAAGKQIPPDTIYVGRFPDAECPKIEFVPHIYNIRMIFYKKNGELLDIILSRAYHYYNRRTSLIYQNGCNPQPENHADSNATELTQAIDHLPEWMRNALKDLEKDQSSR